MKKWMLVVLGLVLVSVGLIGIPTSVLTSLILPARYVSSARVMVESPAPNDPRSEMLPSPNWVATEAYLMLSKRVLTNVVMNLGLARRWAERFKEPGDLPSEVCYALLKRQVEVRQVKNTGLIEIAVSSEDRNEASQIANEIAAVYSKQRREDMQFKAGNGGPNFQPVTLVDNAEPSFRPAKSPFKLMAPGLVVSVLLLLTGTVSLVAAKRFGRVKQREHSNPPPVPL